MNPIFTLHGKPISPDDKIIIKKENEEILCKVYCCVHRKEGYLIEVYQNSIFQSYLFHNETGEDYFGTESKLMWPEG